MYLELGQQQKLSLSHTQRLELKILLSMKQELHDPDFPDPVRGLEGMMTAHKLLQERDATGVLIGGLAEAVWNKGRFRSGLYSNKDVDVAVLTYPFKLANNFEAGIDWWIPQEGRITIKSYASGTEGTMQKRWYQNGHGIRLSFGIKKDGNLKPGLYIPSPKWIRQMREAEIEANMGCLSDNVEVDEKVIEKYLSKVTQRVLTRVPDFILREF